MTPESTEDPELVPAWFPGLWLIAVPVVAGAAMRILVASRPDYSGHLLAGFGGTLLVAWLVARASSGRAIAIFLATLASIGFGWILESTIFALGGFDPVDFHAQSLGAVIAGIALTELRAGDADADYPDGISPLSRNATGRMISTVAVAALVVGAFFAFS